MRNVWRHAHASINSVLDDFCYQWGFHPDIHVHVHCSLYVASSCVEMTRGCVRQATAASLLAYIMAGGGEQYMSSLSLDRSPINFRQLVEHSHWQFIDNKPGHRGPNFNDPLAAIKCAAARRRRTIDSFYWPTMQSPCVSTTHRAELIKFYAINLTVRRQSCHCDVACCVVKVVTR